MACTSAKDDDQYSEKETAARRDATINYCDAAKTALQK
jgi:hypothetical protein